MTWITLLFDKSSRPARKSSTGSNRARLNVEALETRLVPTFLLAALNGKGLWRHNDNAYDGAVGWKQILGSQYSVLKADIDSSGNVAASINGNGTYLYRNGNWQRLTTSVASTVAIANSYSLVYVAASFPGQGVWRFDSSGQRWSRLTTSTAARLDVDMYGDVAGSFQGQGIYRYTESKHSWVQLSRYEATSLAIAGPGYVAYSINGQGTYRYDNSGTRKLTSWVATSLDINSAGNVACAFQVQGTYIYEQFSSPQWHRVSTQSSSSVSIDSGNKIGAATGGGVFYFNKDAASYTGWINLTSAAAGYIKVGGG